MKIGITTYPTAMQSKGGLEVHICETLGGLRQLGVDAEIVDLPGGRLADYDLIHQFCLDHSSCRILQKAKQFGLPTVLTPMLEPIRSRARIAKIKTVRYLMHRVFGWEFRSRWDNAIEGLLASDMILPLTRVERDLIEALCPQLGNRLRVVPNGVSDIFFEAATDGGDAGDQGAGGFVLLASSIVPYKNQLPVVRAARELGYQVVLAGSVLDQDYLDQCLQAGGDQVRYAGEFEPRSEAMSRLYADARFVVLASTVEPFGLVPFEALATGTPAALTTESGVELPSQPPCFWRVNPFDTAAIKETLQAGMGSQAGPQQCRALVEPFRWLEIAGQVRDAYLAVLEGSPPSPAE